MSRKYTRDDVQKLIAESTKNFKSWALESTDLVQLLSAPILCGKCCVDMHDARLIYDERYKQYMDKV